MSDGLYIYLWYYLYAVSIGMVCGWGQLQILESFHTLSRLIRKQDLTCIHIILFIAYGCARDSRAQHLTERTSDSRESSLEVIDHQFYSFNSKLCALHGIFAEFFAFKSSAVWSWSWIWNTSDPSYNGDRGREHEERTGSVRSVGRQRGGPAPDDRAAHHGE